MQDTEQCSSSLLKSLAVLVKILSQDSNRLVKEETESFQGTGFLHGFLVTSQGRHLFLFFPPFFWEPGIAIEGNKCSPLGQCYGPMIRCPSQEMVIFLQSWGCYIGDLRGSTRRRGPRCCQLLGPAPCLVAELFTLLSQLLGLFWAQGFLNRNQKQKQPRAGREVETWSVPRRFDFHVSYPRLLSTTLPGCGTPVLGSGAEDRTEGIREFLSCSASNGTGK